MTAIGPGDFVECVDAGPCPFPVLPGAAWKLLTKGELYQVEGLASNEFGDEMIKLVGLRSGNGLNDGFYAYRFRPIYRPRADLIERLLQPIDETTPEQVPA